MYANVLKYWQEKFKSVQTLLPKTQKRIGMDSELLAECNVQTNMVLADYGKAFNNKLHQNYERS
jgi:hypothetical protein